MKEALPNSLPSTSPWMDDHVLVKQLIKNDDQAWAFVQKELVQPLVEANVKGVRQQLARAGLPQDAVMSRLYENLSRREFAPLRAFRFECAFSSWIYWHVWNAAQGAIREVRPKIEAEMSDDTWLDSLSDTMTPPPDRAVSDDEEREGLNSLLAALWKKNPMRAIVLLLRGELDISSKDVAAFLGKEPSNVDQIFHRAQATMRRLRTAATV